MSFATVFQQRKALVIALGAVLAVGVIASPPFVPLTTRNRQRQPSRH